MQTACSCLLCSDLDILCHYFKGALPTRVQSFGSLSHFRKANKPKEAGEATHCLSCDLETRCPYSASKIYLDPTKRNSHNWPANVVVGGGEIEPTPESVQAALETGPYGRCVYECDNDVCDNQVVNMEFSGGQTASFTMVAFSELICERQTRFHGTRGEMIGDSATIRWYDFASGKTKVVRPGEETLGIQGGGGGGHGGGDFGLMAAFVQAVATGDLSPLGCTPRQVLLSHLLVFAAEEARRKGMVVDVRQFAEEQGAMDLLPNRTVRGDPSMKG